MKEKLIQQVSEYYFLMRQACAWAEKYGFYDKDENNGLTFTQLFMGEIDAIVNKQPDAAPPKTILLLKQAEEKSMHDGFFPHGLNEKLARVFFASLREVVNSEPDLVAAINYVDKK